MESLTNMSHTDFVHLRVHSAYSLLEGAIKIPDLISLCKKEDMPAVAVTDTGNLFGALEFALEAKNSGVQPIIGCQILLSRINGETPAVVNRAIRGNNEFDELVLLVSNQAGYQNLSRLVSKSFLETPNGERPCISFIELEAHSNGLIALTGGPNGAINRLLSEGQSDAAAKTLERLVDVFPGRLYVELMRHGLSEEKAIESILIDLAYKFDLPIVATNDCYFSDPDMFEAHDALLCIAAGAHVEDRDRRRLTRLHSFRSANDMRDVFADLPEAIENTMQIARRCAFMPDEHEPILPPFEVSNDSSESEKLRLDAEAGLALRLEVLGIDEDKTPECV